MYKTFIQYLLFVGVFLLGSNNQLLANQSTGQEEFLSHDQQLSDELFNVVNENGSLKNSIHRDIELDNGYYFEEFSEEEEEEESRSITAKYKIGAFDMNGHTSESVLVNYHFRTVLPSFKYKSNKTHRWFILFEVFRI